VIFGVIVLFAVGALCVVLGLILWKKQKISLVHDHQRNHVSEEDVPAYCRMMGISMIVIGVAIALDGVANLFSWESLGYAALAVGILGSLVIMHRAQKQYNGGWFG
jgi:tellurite resistance protein TehA-like permease